MKESFIYWEKIANFYSFLRLTIYLRIKKLILLEVLIRENKASRTFLAEDPSCWRKRNQMILATSLLFNEFESKTPRQFCEISSSAIYCALIDLLSILSLWICMVIFCGLSLSPCGGRSTSNMKSPLVNDYPVLLTPWSISNRLKWCSGDNNKF